jgi:uncharacterized protein (TIGR00369 family)
MAGGRRRRVLPRGGLSAVPTPKLFGVEIPFVEHLGFELVKMEGGESELRFPLKREYMNSFMVAHGGAIMTLLDVTLATATRSIDPDLGVITIEMKTTFMRPGTGVLTGKGRLMHRSRSMGFAEGTVYDGQGQVCAHATGTFKYVERREPTATTDAISTD